MDTVYYYLLDSQQNLRLYSASYPPPATPTLTAELFLPAQAVNPQAIAQIQPTLFVGLTVSFENNCINIFKREIACTHQEF